MTQTIGKRKQRKRKRSPLHLTETSPEKETESLNGKGINPSAGRLILIEERIVTVSVAGIGTENLIETAIVKETERETAAETDLGGALPIDTKTAAGTAPGTTKETGTTLGKK
jgi:hypothetical protein